MTGYRIVGETPDIYGDVWAGVVAGDVWVQDGMMGSYTHGIGTSVMAVYSRTLRT